MTWTDLTTNVSSYITQLKTRFPHIEEAELRNVRDQDGVIHHVAARHDLTRLEALQEIDDWLFIEGLAHQIGELRNR